MSLQKKAGDKSTEVRYEGVLAMQGAQYLGSKSVRPRTARNSIRVQRSKTQIDDVVQKTASLKWNWPGWQMHWQMPQADCGRKPPRSGSHAMQAEDVEDSYKDGMTSWMFI